MSPLDLKQVAVLLTFTVTNAIPIAVLEATWIHLVNDTSLPPNRPVMIHNNSFNTL
jgi:hypothetical protein